MVAAPDELESARNFWDAQVSRPTHNSWMAHPLVRTYINEQISGEAGAGLWPLDWFQRTYPNRLFPLGLSIGCGTGALERDVLERGICTAMEAFDASPASLDSARSEAHIAGIDDRVHYYLADFNRVSLPSRRYDIVFFHQSLHHVSRMERLLRHVHRALKPGGLLYLEEYVGPSRHFWSERRIAFYRALFQFLPREMRLFDEFAMPIQYDDLSEAIRSGEIRSRVRIGYEIQHERGYGGNLLALMFPDVHVDRLTDDVVQTLIRCERSALASGMPSFYSIIVSEPKRALLARLAAIARYLAEPKVKRILRELRRLRKAEPPGDDWY